MKTLSINGVDLACEERGRGEPLILVHGAVADFRSWETQVTQFATHYRVIAYSRRWHYPDCSRATGARYTPEVHIAHLVGHSYGAAIISMLALRRPDLVRSLVLAEPSLLSLLESNPAGATVLKQAVAATTQVLTRARQRQDESALRDYLEIILGPRGFERVPPKARAVMLDNLHTLEPMLSGINSAPPFTAEHAANLAAPTLLLDGEESPALFRLIVDELEGLLPNAQRITLPGVSHGLHLENPRAFNRAALDFLVPTALEPLAC
jgi:pimeloyl-ACP methyl ester carboxylesterase